MDLQDSKEKYIEGERLQEFRFQQNLKAMLEIWVMRKWNISTNQCLEKKREQEIEINCFHILCTKVHALLCVFCSILAEGNDAN